MIPNSTQALEHPLAHKRVERILVIEDDEDLQKLMRFHLRSEGYEVWSALDGESGIERACQDQPDLVILDIMMPGIDGHEVMQRLRSSYRTRYLPIVVLTALNQTSDRVRGLTEGANDFISKPFVYAELMLRVRNILSWTREQRDMNPLSGLPGNVSIDREITRRIQDDTTFAFMYVDLNSFKAFNDYYGYARGDDAIRMLSDCLGATVERLARQDGFLGHVGGDDFVLLADPTHMDDIGEGIVDDFDRRVVDLYDEEDRARGYIEVPNRREQLERFPLMGVTVVGISTDMVPVKHAAELGDRSTELKHLAKQQAGSYYLSDRRRSEVSRERKAG